MEWYWWAIGWALCGLIALGMDIRDHPAMQENISGEDVWPVVFGPGWLMFKLWDWFLAWKTR